MQVKTDQGIKDVKVVDVTPENYIVPKGEEHLFHVKIEVRKFSTEDGARLSKPRIQKIGKKTFTSGGVKENLKRQGYTIDILHDPAKWEKENQALAEQRKAEQAEKAAEKAKEAKAAQEAAEQKKIDDAVAKALEAQGKQTQKLIDDAVAKALAAASKPAKAADAKAKEETK